MATETIRIEYLHIVHSPFSGLPADGEDGPNENDRTLLFVNYGDAGMYAYISERVRALLPDVEDTDPEELVAQLAIKNAVFFVVDTGWNGINTYAFAPASGD